MILKRFPVEYQMDSQDCGPASLKIIAKYFGRYYSLQYLRDRCGITNQGISLLDLSTGAESIGLRTLAIKCSIEEVVTSVPFPAILFGNENHFIVIYHADKKHVWVSDPAKGRIKYTHAEFRRGWYPKGENKGVLLAVEPTIDFQRSREQKEMEKNSFISVLRYFVPYKNYLKGFLPSIAFNMNPVSFNHSLRLMQNPVYGSYSYVNDYSNTSNAGLTIQQKIGVTGGVFSVSSNLSVLTEFSTHRNNFNTTPLSLNYSQQLLGGYYTYKKLKKIEQTKALNAARRYCSDIADIQIKGLNAFLSLFLADITRKLVLRNIAISDTLLIASRALLDSGHFTEYEYRQVELQANNNLYVYETAQKDYQQLLRQLWALMGKKENVDSVEVSIPDFSLPLTIDSEVVARYARKNNPFALSQEAQRLEAEQVLFNAKLSNRFNANINVNYGLNQYAEHFPDAYRKPDYSQGVMIGFQIPVFQWGINRNKLHMAKNNYRNAILELEEAETNYVNDLFDKVSSYNHGVKLYFLSKRSYQLAQEQYEILSEKFLHGKVSIYEITSAQKELYEALKKYYSSMQTVWNQFFVIRKITLYDFIHCCELMDTLLTD